MSLGSVTGAANIPQTSLAAGTQAMANASKARGTVAARCRPHSVTTSEMGMAPSGDPIHDQQQLQTFLDNIATDGTVGIIETGHWLIHRKLRLHDGIRVCGQGMERTILEARPEDWRQDDYVAMHLDVGETLHPHGIFLSDFSVVGADKSATDNGPLIRLEGMSDFLIERVRTVDASSYGIFVTGYGIGRFTNDIHSNFWNSTHRGIIRQCRSLRGQVGIGCEGGAQNILIMGNHTDGQVLHGFRLASAYDTQLIGNSAKNTRNGYWIDRHRGVHVLHNTASHVERGCVYGGFHKSRDDEISTGLWIMGNQFKSSKSAITDAYQGNNEKYTRIVKIKDNYLQGGGIRLLWSRQVDVQGNDGDGRNAIVTSHQVTGMIGNNFMRLINRADGVEDIGRNTSPSMH
ncbi:right-handed parallel beta-helix repeat-containing protein [Billgrantia saliphila]|uniref:right-handed parallel beta-helix repeat-containing protein n=1 Tax=Billgrantia saliphila TaxID=1848458 RepID=UPI0012DE914A|nr:right-handed parallel beta-helix repeat-containing protein [Halomonas saliphila]